MRASDRGFKGEDGGRVLLRGLAACHRQHLGDVLAIFLPDVDKASIGVVDIIVAVREAEAGLRKVDDVSRRVALVLVDVDIEGRGDTDLLQAGDQRRQLGLVLHIVDRREFGGERLQPERFEPRFVDEAAIEVAYLVVLRRFLPRKQPPLR
jgi:hypothetical protein